MTQLFATVSALSSDSRRESYMLAAKLIPERNLRTIVETGSLRANSDGHSTIIFAHIAEAIGGHVYSIDISQESQDHASEAICAARLSHNLTLILHDSVEMLSNWRIHPIDFLYLDSLDFFPDSWEPCQRHQLAEVGAALGKLHSDSLILLDDCTLAHGGKAPLATAFLLERGWKLLHDGYQRLFSK